MKSRILLLCILAVLVIVPACAKKPADISINKVKYSISLKELDLSYMGLTSADIEPLARMEKLETLNLAGNQIDDISPLKGLKKLTSLKLWGNPVADWSPVDHIETVGGRPTERTQVSVDETSSFVVTGVLIQLAPGSDGNTHYLKADISVSMYNKSKEYLEVSENVTSHRIIINQTFIDVIGKYTNENITENKDKIKSEITSALQVLFETDCIFDTVFAYFLLQ